MINVLIVEDNIHYATTLFNYINRDSKYIRVVEIASNGNEALRAIKFRQEIDVILLDLNLPIYSGIDVLNKIPENKKNKLSKSIIIITGEGEKHNSKLVNNQMVNCILNKTGGIERIAKKIEEITEEKRKKDTRDRLNQKIFQELSYLGYDISHKGTKYIGFCIFNVITSEKSHLDNLKKELYPLVASEYNEKIHNIKCNIIRATENMYYNCEADKIKKYFCYHDCKKPHVKTIIFTIANKLK